MYKISMYSLLPAVLLTASLELSAATDDIRYDWHVKTFSDSAANIVPIPWYHSVNDKEQSLETLSNQEALGIPVTAFFRSNTAPVDNAIRTNSLESLLLEIHSGNTASHIDYILADYEVGLGLTQDDADMALINTVNMVRNHPNPAIKQAWVGDYDEYPGVDNGGNPWGPNSERSTRHEFYLASGANVAQPEIYTKTYFHMHHNNTGALAWGTFLSPSIRSALFYGPLDRYSVAMKALPSGHQMIPWLSAYVVSHGNIGDLETHYPDVAPPPQREDIKALIQHIRLRGATGYATFPKHWMDKSNGQFLDAQGNPYWINEYTEEEYRLDMASAWDSLDNLFNVPGETIILNLDTIKISGIEWSGIQRGNHIGIMVTNLSNNAIQLDLPDVPGLSDKTDWVTQGSHQYFEYILTGNGKMGDYVWEDTNQNGIQDATELGLPGVSIYLLNCSDSSVFTSTISDANGNFLFDQLPIGEYQIKYGLLPGYVFSAEKTGSWDEDSNADPTTGLGPCRTLSDGEIRNGLDAGYYIQGSNPNVDTITVDKAIYYSADNRIWIKAQSDESPTGSAEITATMVSNGVETELGQVGWKADKNAYQQAFIDLISIPDTVILTSETGGIVTADVEGGGSNTDALSVISAIYDPIGMSIWIRADSNASPVGSDTITASIVINGVETVLDVVGWKADKNFYQKNFFNITQQPDSVILNSNLGNTATGSVTVQ